MSVTFQAIQAEYQRLQRRVRLHATLIWAIRGLVLGLTVACGLAIVARLTPLLAQTTVRNLALAIIGAGLSMGLAYGWLRRISPQLLRRQLDRRLGLAERLTTAFELETALPSDLVASQRADTLDALAAVDVQQKLPLRIGRLHPTVLVMTSILLAALLYAPSIQFETVAQNQQVSAEIDEQITELTEIADQIQDIPDLTEEEIAELTEPLEAAIEQLQAQELSPEQAAAVIDQAAQQLQRESGVDSIQQETQALENVGAQLSETPTLEQAADALQSGDLETAASELANADLDTLDAAELDQLADALDAASLNSATGELAESLSAAAEAARSGDAQAAEAALADAADSVAETAESAQQAEAVAEAAAEAQQSAQSAAQAGQPSQQGAGQQAQSNNGQSGNGAGNATDGGQSGSSGQSNAQGQNGGGVGTGSGSGSSDGSDQSGSEAGDQSINQGTAGANGERAYEQIFAPQRIGGGEGIEVEVESDVETTQGNDILAETRSLPDSDETSLVPYNEVFGDYSQAAGQAIENGDVPVGLRGVVRDYFTLLEP